MVTDVWPNHLFRVICSVLIEDGSLTNLLLINVFLMPMSRTAEVELLWWYTS
jgi:hypothetical protein